DGTFKDAQSYDVGSSSDSMAVGDFNGDGHLDRAVVGYDNDGHGTLVVFLGKGDGTFQDARCYAAGFVGAVSVATGDFNGDGKLDLAVADGGTYPNYTDGSVRVLLR